MGTVTTEILDRLLSSSIAGEISSVLRDKGRPIHLFEGALPLVVSIIYRLNGGPIVVAVPGRDGEITRDISVFTGGEAFNMPPAEHGRAWFGKDGEPAGPRLKAAAALRQGKIIVAGPEALLGEMPRELSAGWPILLKEGGEYELGGLLELLVSGGYEREYTVEGWGKFAVRGGIVDIFPSTGERPVRIEFDGDTVVSLREFNVVTQRSSGSIGEIELYPSEDPGGGEMALPEGTLLLAVDPERISARAAEFEATGGTDGEEDGLMSAGEPPTGVPTEGEDEGTLLLDRWGTQVVLDTVGGEIGANISGGPLFPAEPVPEYHGELDRVATEWKRQVRDGTDLFLLLDTEGQVERALEMVDEAGIGRGNLFFGVGTVTRGFQVPSLRIALYSSGDVIGRKTRSRPKSRRSSGTPVASYAELEVGRPVVHEDQGIGIYRGLTSKEVLGVTREYLLIEYAGADRLYVPVNQLSRVGRYIGAENPTIHKLRGKEWGRSKKAARRSAEKIARELLQLYMERKSRPGYSFSADTDWQRELESSFPFEDTPDQAAAVVEVKSDMESEHVMDRLVCGDVGYGKTEVAVRAAMKAVMDSRQVAILVPTTVLARQHFETFSERMASFMIRVRMLSRFLSKGEQEQVAREIGSGDVDVLIGTHRMLQDDIRFKDLGLLVVDEEQRFGVRQKEKLRRIARNVDTLTLTATPIPRTLQMSLSGVRDVTIIDTPPEERYPVSTYVGEYDMGLVRSAIRYEVARGGQVFFVHNRVRSIDRIAATLQAEFPEYSIAVGHGQMHEDDLEKVMLAFADGEHQVLVCTTIIESGLDLPNVNTLIVDRADKLGLAQMYQIRGRVGRAKRRAYAYLFYPQRTTLSEVAVARLSTISEMTALGSGMRVAMRDLEIRGAGSILGAEQSGTIESVGFEMYCELLKESVEVLKGELPVTREAVLELPVDAYFPAEYIADQETRVEEYRRLIVAGRRGAVEEYSMDLKDRFGEPPRPVVNLLELETLRMNAGLAGVEAITTRGGELQVKLAGDGGDRLARISKKARPYCTLDGVFTDPATRTVFLRFDLEGEEDGQGLLLRWLKAIIDDL